MPRCGRHVGWWPGTRLHWRVLSSPGWQGGGLHEPENSDGRMRPQKLLALRNHDFSLPCNSVPCSCLWHHKGCRCSHAALPFVRLRVFILLLAVHSSVAASALAKNQSAHHPLNASGRTRLISGARRLTDAHEVWPAAVAPWGDDCGIDDLWPLAALAARGSASHSRSRLCGAPRQGRIPRQGRRSGFPRLG